MNAKQKLILEILQKRSEYAGQIAQPADIERSDRGSFIYASWYTFYNGENHSLTRNVYYVVIGKRGGVQWWDGKKWRRAKYNVIGRMV